MAKPLSDEERMAAIEAEIERLSAIVAVLEFLHTGAPQGATPKKGGGAAA